MEPANGDWDDVTEAVRPAVLGQAEGDGKLTVDQYTAPPPLFGASKPLHLEELGVLIHQDSKIGSVKRRHIIDVFKTLPSGSHLLPSHRDLRKRIHRNKGIATRSKKLVAPGLTTRNKRTLLGTRELAVATTVLPRFVSF